MSAGALSAEAVRTGAVVSFDGDTLVAHGDAIVTAVESRLLPISGPRPATGWLIDGAVPLLVRGDASIVPLAWLPDTASDPATLRTRADELRRSIFSACEYRQGWPVALDLGAGRPYASELRRTGARRADWWGFDRHAVVLVDYGESARAALALHVVPLGWASETRPAKRVGAVDLGWTWSDAVSAAGPGHAA